MSTLSTTRQSPQIDGGQDLVWDDPRTELDQWEFVRFDYSRPGGNQSEVWVQHPLERMEDGLFIGLYHNPGSTYAGETNLRYRIDFYREEDAGWLSTDSASLNVPAGGRLTVRRYR
ncbi:MAG: hypothetical protein R2873_16735 [Caldilineaceae bacterium]